MKLCFLINSARVSILSQHRLKWSVHHGVSTQSHRRRYTQLAGAATSDSVSPKSMLSNTSNILSRLLVGSVRSLSHATLDPDEIRKFQVLANKWWDVHGEFRGLHALNDLRVPFIRDILLNVHGVHQFGQPLAGLKILDVGCGGGLLTEPLGRIGADVLGIDPVEVSVRTAEMHSSLDPDLRERVRYRACTVEMLTEMDNKDDNEKDGEEKEGLYDAVVASEVLEHLADVDTFIHCCYHILKPGGSLFITTINRTQLSYVLGIVMAEQVLHIVPSGTHEWNKFITPVELETMLESCGFGVQSIRGMFYNPLSGCWSWQESTSVNYALHAIRQTQQQPE